MASPLKSPRRDSNSTEAQPQLQQQESDAVPPGSMTQNADLTSDEAREGEFSDDGDGEGRKKKRRRCVNACLRCKSRKQKCDGNSPCGLCVKGHAEAQCVFVEKPSKKELPKESGYISALESRIATLETALSQLEPDHPEIYDHFQFIEGETSRSVSVSCSTQLGEPSTFQQPVPQSFPSSLTAAPSPSPTFTSTPAPNPNSRSFALHPLQSSSFSLLSSMTQHDQNLPSYYNSSASSTSSPQEVVASTVTSIFGGDPNRRDECLARGLGELSFNVGNEKPRETPITGCSNISRLVRSGVGSGGQIESESGKYQIDGSILPSDEVADGLIRTCYNHIQARYPFMDWNVHAKFHARRHEICLNPISSSDRVGAFFILLVYAVGARISELSSVVERSTSAGKLLQHEVFYRAALHHMDHVLSLHNIVTIQALLMLMMYSFRASSGESVWYLCGFAMRLSVEKGMHLRLDDRVREANPLEAEIRKRVFWSVYIVDRLLADSIGRPVGLEDCYIDEELPVNIDDFETDQEVIRRAQSVSSYPSKPSSPSSDLCTKSTSMTSSIHLIRHFRILSRILKAVYSHRPSGSVRVQLKAEEVSSILMDLDAWRADSHRTTGQPTCSQDWWEKTYVHCKQAILRPLARNAKPGDPFLRTCADAAATACIVHQRMHQKAGLPKSLSALHQIFLSGLNLIHCISRDREALPERLSAQGIRACSNILFVYANLFKVAEPFRDIFEELANKVPYGSQPAVIMSAAAIPSQPSTMTTPGQFAMLHDVDWSAQVGEVSEMLHGNSRGDFVDMLSSWGFEGPVLSEHDTRLFSHHQIASGGVNFDNGPHTPLDFVSAEGSLPPWL